MFENIGRWLRRGKKSGEIGKGRLQLILVQDRTGISPEILDDLRMDIFKVISEYFVVNEDDVEMNLE